MKELFSFQSESDCNNHPEEKSCDTQLKMSLLFEKVALSFLDQSQREVIEVKPWRSLRPGLTCQMKNTLFILPLKVLKIMDAENKGYVTKQDIEALTIEQVKQVANEIDPDPANTEEYEFAVFDLKEVK